MYASIDDIRAASTRISAIVDASDADIELWATEAAVEIDNFCSQSFGFESQRTRKVRAESSILSLEKPLSGYVRVVVDGGDKVVSGDLELFNGENYLIYKIPNIARVNPKRIANPDSLLITGDWGYVLTAETAIVASANDIKTKYNAHRVSLAYHTVADTANTVAAADATDLASAITLLNELKTAITAHMLNATAHSSADDETITAANATDEDSAITLAVDITEAYNAHLSHSGHITEDKENVVVRSANTPVLPAAIRVVFLRLIQRLAVRSNEEDFTNFQLGYASETDGDGYTYNLSNPTLRNLIQPSEFRLLWPYINHGTI